MQWYTDPRFSFVPRISFPGSVKMLERWSRAALCAVVALACATCAKAVAETPEQLCAAESGRLGVRKALTDTASVVCFRGEVRGTHSCPTDPPGLAFDEAQETCVP